MQKIRHNANKIKLTTEKYAKLPKLQISNPINAKTIHTKLNAKQVLLPPRLISQII